MKAGGNPNCRLRGRDGHPVQSLPGLSQEMLIHGSRSDIHGDESVLERLLD